MSMEHKIIPQFKALLSLSGALYMFDFYQPVVHPAGTKIALRSRVCVCVCVGTCVFDHPQLSHVAK